MNSVSWAILPAILLTFIYIFVPGMLWLVDLILRKPIGSKVFQVEWKPLWIALAVAFWIIDRLWVYYF